MKLYLSVISVLFFLKLNAEVLNFLPLKIETTRPLVTRAQNCDSQKNPKLNPDALGNTCMKEKFTNLISILGLTENRKYGKITSNLQYFNGLLRYSVKLLITNGSVYGQPCIHNFTLKKLECSNEKIDLGGSKDFSIFLIKKFKYVESCFVENSSSYSIRPDFQVRLAELKDKESQVIEFIKQTNKISQQKFGSDLLAKNRNDNTKIESTLLRSLQDEISSVNLKITQCNFASSYIKAVKELLASQTTFNLSPEESLGAAVTAKDHLLLEEFVIKFSTEDVIREYSSSDSFASVLPMLLQEFVSKSPNFYRFSRTYDEFIRSKILEHAVDGPSGTWSWISNDDHLNRSTLFPIELPGSYCGYAADKEDHPKFINLISGYKSCADILGKNWVLPDAQLLEKEYPYLKNKLNFQFSNHLIIPTSTISSKFHFGPFSTCTRVGFEVLQNNKIYPKLFIDHNANFSVSNDYQREKLIATRVLCHCPKGQDCKDK